MTAFTTLKPVIDTLIGHCKQVDQARGAYHEPLFDRRLFKARAKILLPYALETQATYHEILREQANKLLTASRAQYLADRLTNQIAAVQRELANYDLRQDRHQVAQKTSNQLYNELAQHHDWQKRLKELVLQRRHAVSVAPNNHKAQAALELALQRLERCEESMKAIERQINLENPKRNDQR